jgi:hypothetical protein
MIPVDRFLEGSCLKNVGKAIPFRENGAHLCSKNVIDR